VWEKGGGETLPHVALKGHGGALLKKGKEAKKTRRKEERENRRSQPLKGKKRVKASLARREGGPRERSLENMREGKEQKGGIKKKPVFRKRENRYIGKKKKNLRKKGEERRPGGETREGVGVLLEGLKKEGLKREGGSCFL